MTLIEVTVVVVVIGGLFALLLPALNAAKRSAQQVNCINNLKNVGLALRVFSTDNEDRFPMLVSVTNGGTLEWNSNASQLWRNFLCLSNSGASDPKYAFSPSVVHCPSDSEKEIASSFLPNPSYANTKVFNDNKYLSYFLNLNASVQNSRSILSGDRDLSTNEFAVGAGRLVLTTNAVLGFTKVIHHYSINILFGDGMVNRMSAEHLNEAWRANIAIAQTNSLHGTNVWLVP
jgi:type II secretory pathway pseudopilin PulG